MYESTTILWRNDRQYSIYTFFAFLESRDHCLTTVHPIIQIWRQHQPTHPPLLSIKNTKSRWPKYCDPFFQIIHLVVRQYFRTSIKYVVHHGNTGFT